MYTWENGHYMEVLVIMVVVVCTQDAWCFSSFSEILFLQFVKLLLSFNRIQVFSSTLWQSWPNKASLKYLSLHLSVRLSFHEQILRFKWNLACR